MDMFLKLLNHVMIVCFTAEVLLNVYYCVHMHTVIKSLGKEMLSHHPGLAKTTLQGTVRGARRKGRQRKWWEDNVREWTGLGQLRDHWWCPYDPPGQGTDR